MKIIYYFISIATLISMHVIAMENSQEQTSETQSISPEESALQPESTSDADHDQRILMRAASVKKYIPPINMQKKDDIGSSRPRVGSDARKSINKGLLEQTRSAYIKSVDNQEMRNLAENIHYEVDSLFIDLNKQVQSCVKGSEITLHRFISDEFLWKMHALKNDHQASFKKIIALVTSIGITVIILQIITLYSSLSH